MRPDRVPIVLQAGIAPYRFCADGTIDLPKRTDIHRVTFFAGEVIGEEQEYEIGRQRLWISLEDLPHIITDVNKSVADEIVWYINDLFKEQ